MFIQLADQSVVSERQDSETTATVVGANSAKPGQAPGNKNKAVKTGSRQWGRILTPYFYVLPAIVLLVVWTYRPLVEAFGLSFYDWNLLPTAPKEFVAFQNYADIMNLPELHQALWNTGIYIGAFLVFSIVLPLIFALISTKIEGKWKTFYQSLIFVPFLITPVATSAVWRWLFDVNGGVIPAIASSLGLKMDNVFRDPALAIIALIVIVGWGMLGFGVLVIAAGIAGINPDYAAAASLDGASPRRIRWKITIPLLSPTLLFLALMTILLSAQWTYPMIDILTQGGPTGATNNIYYLLYQYGFMNFDVGISSAAGILFFVGFSIIAWIFVELTERLSFYDN